MQLQVETTIYKDGAIGGDIANARALTQAKYAVSTTVVGEPIKEAVFDPQINSWSPFAGAEVFVKFTNPAPALYTLTKDLEINEDKIYYVLDIDNKYIKVEEPIQEDLAYYYELQELQLVLKANNTVTGTPYVIKNSEGDILDSIFYWDKPNSVVHFTFDGTYWRVLDVVSASKYNSLVTNINEFSSEIGEQIEKINSDFSKDITDVKSEIKQTKDSIDLSVQEVNAKVSGNYAISSTIADESIKIATIIPEITDWPLYSGATVVVKFEEDNNISNPLLNINNTGNIAIKSYNGNSLSESEYSWKANSVFAFTLKITYFKTSDINIVDGKLYYELRDNKYILVEEPDRDNLENYYECGMVWLMQDNDSVRLSNAESNIKANAREIELKVSETDFEGNNIISKINLDSTTATISAARVKIDGTTIFSDGTSINSIAQNAAAAAASGKADETTAIQSVTTSTEYRLSDSSTSLVDNENIGYDWSTTIPIWSTGKYLWVRVATEYTPITGSATIEYTPGIEANEWGIYDSQLTAALSTANTANMNANSAAANIITKQEYRLSDSDTSLVDSENIGYDWSTTIPTWSANKYLWTRFKIEKTTVGNNSTVSYTPGIEQNQWGIYDSALTTALSTANNAAPKADAIKQEQRIYYRSKVGGSPPSGNGLPTVWITNNVDIWNENNTTSTEQREEYVKTGWTTKITPIAKSTGRFIRTQDTSVIQNKSYYQLVGGEYQLVTNPSNSNINNYYEAVDKYLYLWTCIQRQKVNGDIDYTDILLDDSTTVIDGGKIITGSIDANSINATSINAWGQLTVGAFTQEDQEAILNSKIDIDGAVGELLEETVKRVQRIYYRTNSNDTPQTPGTTSSSWVTNGNIDTDTPWQKYNEWSTRVPPMADSVDSTTKYLYLWTCIQIEVVQGDDPDNPVSYTDVLLDDSTTVIEGGRIATGSIAANKISVNNLAAIRAQIGNWHIEDISNTTVFGGGLYTNNYSFGSGILISPGYRPNNSVAVGVLPVGKTWAITAGNRFGVTIDGDLYANSATLGGTNGISITSTGVTLGSGCSISWSNVTDKDSVANKSDIPSDAYITQITNDTIKTTNVVATNLQIAAANIKSGTIDSARIPNLEIGKITNLSTELTTAGNTANSYIYYTASTGLILAGTNPSSATTNYVKLKAPGTGVTDAGVTIVGNNANYKTTINSDGMKIYAGDTTNAIASFGSIARIGTNNNKHITIDSTGLNIWTGPDDSESTDDYQIAKIGLDENGDLNTRLGLLDEYHTIITNDSFVINDGTGAIFTVDPSGATTTGEATLVRRPQRNPPGGIGYSLTGTISKNITYTIRLYNSTKEDEPNNYESTTWAIPSNQTASTQRSISKNSNTLNLVFTPQGSMSLARGRLTATLSRTSTSIDFHEWEIVYTGQIEIPKFDFKGKVYASEAVVSYGRCLSNTGSGYGVWIGRGISNNEWTTNRGVYDVKSDSWIIRRDDNNRVQIPRIYSTKVSGVEVYVNDAGFVGTSGSSKRWKKEIRQLKDLQDQKQEILEGIKSIQPVLFKYREGMIYADDYDSDVLGLIAEDVYDNLPLAAILDPDDSSLVDDWNQKSIITAILMLAQEAIKENELLKERVRLLEEK